MSYSENELPLLLATDLSRYYADLVLCYQHRLYTFAHRLTGNPHDAEDIVQEAFVGAYVSLEHYPLQRIQTLKLRSWLYRVTLNVFNHSARGTRLHLIPLNLSEESQEIMIEGSEDEQPEALFEQQERQYATGMASSSALVCRPWTLYRSSYAELDRERSNAWRYLDC
ncbi:MAG: hypothetical protein JO031_09055 [Ktedonobacteraceae bacterium]|nr:hypothetical protein [Ktedonobacteraceae bacterium]